MEHFHTKFHWFNFKHVARNSNYNKAFGEWQNPSAHRSENEQPFTGPTVWKLRHFCLHSPIICPRTSLHEANGQHTMTLYNYRSRQFHKTSKQRSNSYALTGHQQSSLVDCRIRHIFFHFILLPCFLITFQWPDDIIQKKSYRRVSARKT